MSTLRLSSIIMPVSDTFSLTQSPERNFLDDCNKSLIQRYGAEMNLDSPRTQQAMSLLGIEKEQLQRKTKQDFLEPPAPSDIVDLRFAHYVKRLQSLLA